MKKIIAVLTILLICTVALCACTPNVDQLKKKYEDNGYKVDVVDFGEINTKVENEKIEYSFSARKGDIEVSVLAFSSVDDAKAFYDEINKVYDGLNELGGKYKVRKEGNAVIYGDEEAVKIA